MTFTKLQRARARRTFDAREAASMHVQAEKIVVARSFFFVIFRSFVSKVIFVCYYSIKHVKHVKSKNVFRCEKRRPASAEVKFSAIFKKKKKVPFRGQNRSKKKTQKVPLRDIKKRPRHRYLLKNERLRD